MSDAPQRHGCRIARALPGRGPCRPRTREKGVGTGDVASALFRRANSGSQASRPSVSGRGETLVSRACCNACSLSAQFLRCVLPAFIGSWTGSLHHMPPTRRRQQTGPLSQRHDSPFRFPGRAARRRRRRGPHRARLWSVPGPCLWHNELATTDSPWIYSSSEWANARVQDGENRADGPVVTVRPESRASEPPRRRSEHGLGSGWSWRSFDDDDLERRQG